jgi:3-hydroxyacyl-[acyl-carrier-protein] dehydratase
MSSLVESGQTLTAHFAFPEDFIGFQGHFPGNKILPGVCQIQCAVTMLEKWKNLPVVLKEIVLAKFFSTVTPLEEFMCMCKGIEHTDGDFILRASIRKGDKKISEMKLKVRFKNEP